MNISKFTQKSIQAINNLEKTAYDFGNQEIEQEHLLYSLLHQEDSLILKLVEKMEINKEHFLNRLDDYIGKRTKVSGGQPYIGQYLNKALVSAEDEAKAMGDEYVSVEHLFLSLLKNESSIVKEQTIPFLRDLYDHVVQIIETIEISRDNLSSLIDLYLSNSSAKMNETMKVLTIIATIFIPLTFIVGVYGMNFEYMPELKWKSGYPLIMLFMLLASMLMIYFFKKKKWL